MGLTDVWMAYQVDSIVFAFGSALKAELEAVEGKTKQEIKRKRERLLHKWLELPLKYRSPGMVGSGVAEQFTVKGDV